MELKFSDEKKIFNTHTDGIPYLSFDMLDRLGVPNLYTTRFVSYNDELGTGETGLRLCVMKGDVLSEAAPHVLEMRSRLAEQLGSSIDMEYITDQKQTNYVNVVREEDLGPLWPEEKPLHRQYVDGMVTDIPGVLLTVFGGDCPSVYIVDPVKKCAGLVHAGWKGTLGKIPEVAISRMTLEFGCEPADMYATIGPGICQDCYEMGDEVYDAFASEWSAADAEKIFSKYALNRDAIDSGRATCTDIEAARGWKYHLDLRAANKMTLLRAGVPEDHIAVSNVCTMCNVDTFYSFRARRMENEQCAMLVNRFE